MPQIHSLSQMSFGLNLLEVHDCLRVLKASFYGGTEASGFHEGTGTTKGVDDEDARICWGGSCLILPLSS
jgi:hypothetical protein